jgi:hypothetical protein
MKIGTIIHIICLWVMITILFIFVITIGSQVNRLEKNNKALTGIVKDMPGRYVEHWLNIIDKIVKD